MSTEPVDEEALLAKTLATGREYHQIERPNDAPASAHGIVGTFDFSQWQICANGIFRPAARTTKAIQPGAYFSGHDDNGFYLRKGQPESDTLIELPDSASARVLEGIRRFWKSADRYRKHGLIFKRGILLWGPPGGGKTAAVTQLALDIIHEQGIVLICLNPEETSRLVQIIRSIEGSRPIIVIFEDLDELIAKFGEHGILALLDGENQTHNVVYLATTNYPERLGARIVNRPSRFDERVYIGMPSAAARSVYLQHATRGLGGRKPPLERWVSETEGLSIAHLRELIAAVLCLDQSYESVLKRLRAMSERPKDVEGFERRKLGLA